MSRYKITLKLDLSFEGSLSGIPLMRFFFARIGLFIE